VSQIFRQLVHEATRNGQFSSDRNWVAYTSIASGKLEIYVTSFPDVRGKWQVSDTGGTQPRWRGDGKELFYLASDGKMMAVPLTVGGHFDSGAPVALFQANVREQVAGSELVTYDATKDGQRFLINTPLEKAETKPMILTGEWISRNGSGRQVGHLCNPQPGYLHNLLIQDVFAVRRPGAGIFVSLIGGIQGQ
jgi:hypothetical protein